jgi:K+-transporting ATPase, c chain
VADARKIPVEKVKELIKYNTDEPDLGIFGDPGVNVLMLNLALDKSYLLPPPAVAPAPSPAPAPAAPATTAAAPTPAALATTAALPASTAKPPAVPATSAAAPSRPDEKK